MNIEERKALVREFYYSLSLEEKRLFVETLRAQLNNEKTDTVGRS